ncbi:MAG: NUDIX domain-containing protein [Caldilineales bacterium]|nr:NUDIX domain-containing protein [Caldilineales bacterium]
MTSPDLSIFPRPWLETLAGLDADWQGGDHVSPQFAAAELAIWRKRLGYAPTAKEEQLDIVDAAGEVLGWWAPRWFCHLTGLRHRVVHIFLTTPQGFLALQMRAHDKAEWPSLFDTTVGGHVKAGQGWLEGAFNEIEEEVGLPADGTGEWLAGGVLQAVGDCYERYAVGDGAPPIRNRQVNQTYAGVLTEHGLAQVRFADGEVAGLYLCRPEEAKRMIEQDFLIAPGMQHAFWHWWHGRAVR